MSIGRQIERDFSGSLPRVSRRCFLVPAGFLRLVAGAAAGTLRLARQSAVAVWCDVCRLAGFFFSHPKPEGAVAIRDEDVVYVANKGGHTYVIAVGPGTVREAIHCAYQWACNPELNFDFQDASAFSDFIEACPPAGGC